MKHLDKDYDLEQDITVEFWKDPSRKVVMDLLEILGRQTSDSITEEEAERIDVRYYECVSLIIVDCDIEGISFDTPDESRAAFEAEFLPWGIFHQAMMLYVAELTREHSILKNVLRRVSAKQNPPEEDLASGIESGSEEEE
jgi:hypothetical protein